MSPQVRESLEVLEEISARARAQGSALVCYTVEDVEAVCAALRDKDQRPNLSLVPSQAPRP